MADTSKMAGKKAFACVMNMKGDTQQIFTICNSNKVRADYNDIHALAQKFMTDFDNAGTYRYPEVA